MYIIISLRPLPDRSMYMWAISLFKLNILNMLINNERLYLSNGLWYLTDMRIEWMELLDLLFFRIGNNSDDIW